MLHNLRTAFGLLTTLPFGMPEDWQPGDSGRAGVWYPLVGLVIGGLTWLAWRGLALVSPPLVTGALALLVWVALTGGLHLDGLADCCDGLLASTTPEKRLEIMKDPRLGTFGGTGLLLALLLKFAALSSLTVAASPGLFLAASLGRWCLLPAGFMPLARSGGNVPYSGMGADFASGLRRGAIFVGAALPLGLVIVLGWPGVFAALAGLLAAASVLGLAKARINGVTGDVFGAVVEVAETAILLVFTLGAQ